MDIADPSKALLEQMANQYRLYREEVRAYLQLAGGSASLLVLLLFGELTAAKDNPTLLALVPLSVVSYASLFSLLFVYANIAAEYSALIELKMNGMLKIPAFQFENYYVGPKPRRGEGLPFMLIWALMWSLPLVLCGYALWQFGNYHRKTAILMSVFVVLGLAGIFLCTIILMLKRKKLSGQLLDEWPNQLQKFFEGTST